MLNSQQIAAELQKLGFVLDKDNERIKGLLHPATQTRVYVKTSAAGHPVSKAPLVIHPDNLNRCQDIDVTGVRSGVKFHNSNLTGYPKTLHTGANPIAHGLDIDVPTAAALQQLLTLLMGTGSNDIYGDILAADQQLDGLDETTREQVIDARRGQGLFRAELEKAWDTRCCVTGVKQSALLRASHIKPWRSSNNHERLDPNNGLLLVASLDAAFDAGLISFRFDGAIQLSPQLKPADALSAGIYNDLSISKPISSAQQHYLQYHRDHIFRN